MIGSLLSGIAGSLAGSVLGSGSSAFTAKQQYRYSKKLAQQSPSWNVHGLRKAGLNPILAANPAGGSPSAGIAPAGSADISGGAESLSSASYKKRQEDLVGQHMALATAQTQQAYQLSRESFARQQTEMHRASSAQAQAKIDKQVQEVYSSSLGKHILPVLRASAQAGLRPDLVMGNLTGSAARMAKLFFTRR